jgi:ATP adenylyltransferase
MERLWAPWRNAYVTSASAGTSGCIFCQASDERGVRLQPPDSSERGVRLQPDPSSDGIPDPSRDALMLVRGRVAYVILNKYPYNNAHMMVVPNRHAPNLASLSAEEQAELMTLTRHAEIALTEAYAPHGINIGINLGKAAGAGVLDHLHVHLVPRWNGDTNFMTAIGNTRVLPEDLGESAKRLRPIFERLATDDV